MARLCLLLQRLCLPSPALAVGQTMPLHTSAFPFPPWSDTSDWNFNKPDLTWLMFPALILTHEPFGTFSVPSPAEKGKAGASSVGTWCIDRVSPLQIVFSFPFSFFFFLFFTNLWNDLSWNVILYWVKAHKCNDIPATWCLSPPFFYQSFLDNLLCFRENGR